MDMSPFVSSDPAARRDGWSPERKLRFLDRLAACGNVRTACAAVGMSRETAYVLRRRDALFARGWATALVLAREASIEVLADKAIEGIEEEVWYRGELVGTRRRFDARLLLAHIARLDKQVEETGEAAAADVERFDEILACIAGAEVPEELRVEGEPLPLDRESSLQMADDKARDAVDDTWAEREGEEEDGLLSDEQHAAYQDELGVANASARAEAAQRWDAWFRDACGTVDAVLGQAQAQPQDAKPGDPDGADASSSTVSDVSGSPPFATFIGPDGRRYAHA
jgi:hypothetical protein